MWLDGMWSFLCTAFFSWKFFSLPLLPVLSPLIIFLSAVIKFYGCIALRWESSIKSVSQRADRNAEHPSTKPFGGLLEMYWKHIEGKLVVWLKLVCYWQVCNWLVKIKSKCWLVFFPYLNVSKFLWLWKWLSHSGSLRKQPTFRDTTTDFPTKWRLRNKHRNSILMTHHYPDMGSASDWLKLI